MSVIIVEVQDGYVLTGVIGNNETGVCIIAEHARSLRVFKRLDSAITVCKRLGFPVVSVQLGNPDVYPVVAYG